MIIAKFGSKFVRAKSGLAMALEHQHVRPAERIMDSDPWLIYCPGFVIYQFSKLKGQYKEVESAHRI